MKKVLVVDDSLLTCSIIENVLQSEGYTVTCVHTGKQAIDAVASNRPDLILLDVIIPDWDGYKVCRYLKKKPSTAEIPVIFITSMSDQINIGKGFEVGGADYVCKPFGAEELLARVNVHYKNKQMRDMLKKANAELEFFNRKLSEMLEERRLWAQKDQLTGVFNRHYVTEMLPQWEIQSNNGKVFSLILMDIDDFKVINDTYGHCAGDHLLCCISKLLSEYQKNAYTVIRWGGEEFLILLPNLDVTKAAKIADAMREKIANSSFVYDKIPLTCTVTMGVVQLDLTQSIEKNIIKADTALYEGKHSGKNCIVIK